MKMTSMELKDFRCWEEYKITFADRFNLLIGDNASGKTAMSEALAIGLGTIVWEAFGKRDDFLVTVNDNRRVVLIIGQERQAKPEQILSIDYNILLDGLSALNIDKNMKLQLEKSPNAEDIRFSRGKLKEIEEKIDRLGPAEQPKIILPLIAYYSSSRFWKVEENEKFETGSPGFRLDGYINSLHPSMHLLDFLKWIKKYEFISLQRNERRDVFEAVKIAITSCIDDATDIWWDIERDELVLTLRKENNQEQEFPFNSLSDGYRNILAMVGDMAHRAAILNPHLGVNAAKETPGIVIIDELDLHLHLKWQKTIVQKLMDTFPKVQFVATTHSPFIIQSLKDVKDTQVWDMDKAAPVELPNQSIEDIAEETQGVKVPQWSHRFEEMMDTAEEYYRLLEESDKANEVELTRIKQKLDELSERFSDNAAYHAYLNMKRQSHRAGNNKL